MKEEEEDEDESERALASRQRTHVRRWDAGDGGPACPGCEQQADKRATVLVRVCGQGGWVG